VKSGSSLATYPFSPKNLWHHFASRDLKPIQKVTGVDSGSLEGSDRNTTASKEFLTIAVRKVRCLY